MNANSFTPSGASATSLKILAKPHRQWSLASRLTTWYSGSAFVLILSTTCFLYWVVVTTLEHEDDQYLHDMANAYVAILRNRPEDIAELRAQIERDTGRRPAGEIFVRILDPDGRVVAQTVGFNEKLNAEKLSVVTPADMKRSHSAEVQTPGGQIFRVLTVPGANRGAIQVAMDRTAEEELLNSYRWYAAMLLIVAMLVCAGVGHLLASHGMAPVRKISQAAERIRSSTLHERVQVDDLPSELAVLADTLNDMLVRLENAFQRLDRFSSDIAHELRTPVNNMRGETEVALGRDRTAEQYREILASELEEFGRLTQLIDNLLFLARAENPQTQIQRQTLDVGIELTTVRDFFQAHAEEMGVELAMQAPPNVLAEIDRTLFQRAVSNLVANALAHTPRDGRITLKASRIESGIRVEVEDTGQGIAPEHLPHVFDRFYRGDPSRSGSIGSVGLGLALVNSIAMLHGGSCSIASEVGKGTCVRIEIPTVNSKSGAM